MLASRQGRAEQRESTGQASRRVEVEGARRAGQGRTVGGQSGMEGEIKVAGQGKAVEVLAGGSAGRAGQNNGRAGWQDRAGRDSRRAGRQGRAEQRERRGPG